MLINSCIERVGQSATFPADKSLVPCLTFSSVRSSINDVIIMEMSSEQTEIFYQTEKQKKMQCQSFYAQTCAYNLQVNCIHISTVNYKNVAQKISKQNSSNR